MDTKYEYETLNYFLKKKRLNYNEFNELIGNYFVIEYEELEDNYYLLNIINSFGNIDNKNSSYYTDYIQIIN